MTEEEEKNWAIATIVAAARGGDAEAEEWLRTRVVDQSWRLDPANDHRQPEVAEQLAKAFTVAGGLLH